jgi:hypothetical protein
MSGAEVDTFFVDATRRSELTHLKPFLVAAVNAGRKADGYLAVVGPADWTLTYTCEFGDPVGRGLERGTNGFQALNHRDHPMVLRNDRGTRAVAIHETVHLYGDGSILYHWGSDFNEGVTEYFTRLLTDRNGNPASQGGPPRTGYQRNWEFVRNMLALLGQNRIEQETVLAEMYFSGATDLLGRRFDRACKEKKLRANETANRWEKFEAAIRHAQWHEACAQMP